MAAGETFKDLERAGWTARATAYDGLFGRITEAAISPTLDALEPLNGRDLLDVSCGTGHIAGVAARRGARAAGIDFAETMIETARANYPELALDLGDAEALDFDDASFDAVACGFGLLHFENPDRAIAEAFRVLRDGGRYAFTVWCGPEAGGDLFAIVTDAIAAHGTADVDLPPAPPWFRFAERAECDRVLGAAGFEDVRTAVLPLTWQPGSGAEVLEMIYKSIVRTPMLLERQPEAAREAIHVAIVEGAEATRGPTGLNIDMPALLVCASKPG